MRVASLSAFLFLAATCVAAPAQKDAVLFKTFNDVKAALLAGQHLTAWADFTKCTLLSEKPVDGARRNLAHFVGEEYAEPSLNTWTQKFDIWQWMSKIENQEVFWFPSHQALGQGDFASERVLLWQNGTLLLDVVSWGTGDDKNVTQMALNCTLGTSALFRGYSDLMKPIDTAANAIAASAQQGIELTAVVLYDTCTKIQPPTEVIEEGDAIQVIGGHALTDALTGSDGQGGTFYMGASSFLERTPDDNVKAMGDDIAIMQNGKVYIDTFIDFFLGSKVVYRDYMAECDFGKGLLVFA